MNYKQKLARIIGITGWSRDRLADMLDVSNGTLNRWIKGRAIKQAGRADKIDFLYKELVLPFECEIEMRANAAEKKLLKARIGRLSDGAVCRKD